MVAVEVYFYSKDENIPIKLQLRTAQTGDENTPSQPTNILLPFGEVVLDSSEVITNVWNKDTRELIINENGIDTIITSSGPGGHGGDPTTKMKSTRFVFSSPIYINEGDRYAFVLLSDSNNYNVWVSEFGPDIEFRDGVTFGDEEGINYELG
ncbi:hypothetical protein RZS08_11650, partial [Arthrospira platensis SPKY1]|nr:hypothetical protein [Arthrospira platensis SPKY1]